MDVSIFTTILDGFLSRTAPPAILYRVLVFFPLKPREASLSLGRSTLVRSCKAGTFVVPWRLYPSLCTPVRRLLPRPALTPFALASPSHFFPSLLSVQLPLLMSRNNLAFSESHARCCSRRAHLWQPPSPPLPSLWRLLLLRLAVLASC